MWLLLKMASQGPTHRFTFGNPTECSIERANKLIRVTGQLDGRGNTCGSGNRCWELAYGFGEPLILRTSHPLAEFGTCVTYVGPLGVFRGNLQLDSINLDWLKVYE